MSIRDDKEQLLIEYRHGLNAFAFEFCRKRKIDGAVTKLFMQRICRALMQIERDALVAEMLIKSINEHGHDIETDAVDIAEIDAAGSGIRYPLNSLFTL